MTVIVAWLWQGAAVALFTAITVRYVRWTNAATRHAIWWLALATVVLLPVVLMPAASGNGPTHEFVQSIAQRDDRLVVPQAPTWIVDTALAIWAGAALIGTLRIVKSLRQLVRLKQRSRPFDRVRESRLTMWMVMRQHGRRADLRVAEIAGGACALGLGRPTILVSQHLVQVLSDEQLDQIVMHEQAHLDRFDDWLRLVQAFVASLAGLHPAVWFINRRIDAERESACDDWVVARSGSAARYAACLADAAALCVGTLNGALIPAAFRSSAALEARVRRLLDPATVRSLRVVMPVVAVVLLLFASAVVAFGASGPVVVFHDAARDSSHATIVPGRTSAPPVTRAHVLTDVPGGTSLATRSATKLNTRTIRTPVATRNVPAEPQQSVEPAARDTSPGDDPAEPRSEITALEASHLRIPQVAVASMQPLVTTTSFNESLSRSREAWGRAVDAGVAIGNGAKRTGTAIAGLFTRAGKAVARSF